MGRSHNLESTINIFSSFDMSLRCCIPRIDYEGKRFFSESQELISLFVSITFLSLGPNWGVSMERGIKYPERISFETVDSTCRI